MVRLPALRANHGLYRMVGTGDGRVPFAFRESSGAFEIGRRPVFSEDS